MADNFVRFFINCGTCGQELVARGVTEHGSHLYHHERPGDCADGAKEVEVPSVTIDQLFELFAPAQKHQNAEAKKKAPAPAKKAAKK